MKHCRVCVQLVTSTEHFSCRGVECPSDYSTMDQKVSQKEITPDEVLWKHRFEILAMDVAEMIDKTRIKEICKDDHRAFVESDVLYVSFSFDVVDTEKKAKELWGKNYDTFRIWKRAEDNV